MVAEPERLVVTLVVLVGGAILLVFLGPTGAITDGIVALWGLVVGWWFPRTAGRRGSDGSNDV